MILVGCNQNLTNSPVLPSYIPLENRRCSPSKDSRITTSTQNIIEKYSQV